MYKYVHYINKLRARYIFLIDSRVEELALENTLRWLSVPYKLHERTQVATSPWPISVIRGENSQRQWNLWKIKKNCVDEACHSGVTSFIQENIRHDNSEIISSTI